MKADATNGAYGLTPALREGSKEKHRAPKVRRPERNVKPWALETIALTCTTARWAKAVFWNLGDRE